MTIPATGTYVFSVRATSTQSGSFVGVNINGLSFQSLPIDMWPKGTWGSPPYMISFSANKGDIVRVWMYSPATPTWTAIDAATLEEDFSTP